MTLQQEATNMINSLPDDSVQFVIEMMKRMVSPVAVNTKPENPVRFGTGIGILNDPSGFDEMDDDVLDYFEKAGYL